MVFKKQIIFLLIIGCFCLIGFCISSFIHSEELKENTSEKELTSHSAFNKRKVEFTFKNELIKIKNNLVYSGNDTAKKYPLFNEIHDKVLVFRFSGEMCDACIDFGINKLKEHFPEYAKSNRIMLLASKLNPRLKEGYYNKHVVSFYSDTARLGMPFEKHSTPYFCILDEDKVTRMFFIPEKTDPELTDKYLEEVKKRLIQDVL